MKKEKKAESELKKVNAQILAEKQNFESILREMGDAVIVTDSKGKVVLVNRAMEEMCGKCVRELLSNDLKKGMKWVYERSGKKPDDMFDAVINERKTVRSRESLLIVNDKGKGLLIDVVATPIMNNKRYLEGSVWILRDTTKEKELGKNEDGFCFFGKSSTANTTNRN